MNHNRNHNPFMFGGMRIDPVHERVNDYDLARMRQLVERLNQDIRSKDAIIAVLNSDIASLRHSNDSSLVNTLRRELSAKDREKDAMEARYRNEVARLEGDNARLRRQAVNAAACAHNDTIADLRAELARTREELVRARGMALIFD
jgi:chromosome segregation ATPase